MASCWGSPFPKAGVTVLKIRKAYVWLLSILLLPVAAVYIVLRCMSRGLALLTAFVFERLGPKPLPIGGGFYDTMSWIVSLRC